MQSSITETRHRAPRSGQLVLFLAVLALSLALAGCEAPPTTVVPNPTPLIGDTPDPFITVTWSTDEGCQLATVDDEDTVTTGPCEGEQRVSTFGADMPQAVEDYAFLINGYAPFTVETPSGTVEFGGEGTVLATPAQQRMIAEWTRWVAENAAGGVDAATFLALNWQRQGGVAGFCDQLTVYRYGIASANTCGPAPGEPDRYWLTPVQLAQLYDWLDAYAPLQIEQTDPGTADAMIITLMLNGTGDAQADAEQQQELLDWASTVYQFSAEDTE